MRTGDLENCSIYPLTIARPFVPSLQNHALLIPSEGKTFWLDNCDEFCEEGWEDGDQYLHY